MLFTSKSFVQILFCLMVSTSVSVYGINLTSLTDEELDKLIDDYVPDDSGDYVFLVMGGYRPKFHHLAKHLVSVQGGSQKKFFGDNHICGGTIISKNVVLTAAHCVINERGVKRYHNFLVVAGTPFLFESIITMRSYKIIKEIVNPIFSYTSLRGDFALLVSEKTFDEDGLSIQRIPLQDVKPEAGWKCTTLGWGRIFPDGPLPNEVLYVDLTLVKRLKCSENFPMNPSIICASNDDSEKGVWRGDSGGPLICNGKLTGVVSFGYLSGGPGYFANVYEHRNWILGSFANKLHIKFEMFFLYWCFLFIIFYLNM